MESHEYRLRELLLEHLDLEEDELSRDMTLESMAVDSLELLQLTVAIEDEFDITLDDDDLRHIETLGDMEDHIGERMRE